MVCISSWCLNLVPGVICSKLGGVSPRLPSHVVSRKRSTFKIHCCNRLVSRKVPGRSITHLSLAGHSVKCASFVERNYQSSVNNDEDLFLINTMKQAIRAAKSMLLFLVEQPSQLKYIEWPGFQSTLKTATLALVLVGLFIIALSSVDSALSYMLALFLRRTA
ncbi:uncharacterized protein LOC107811198 [Nicotiana tabacum]|uniref:Preprotein translocase subunit SECE1-like n=1 Tax=Nicotiana tabacum TaxID=4097 RepID=A0A1S4BRZ5_TOBAC|nr:uncharacterized protein LOC104103442 [Nicotiana tomentosiformis]XP_016491568.1 PREDICTED: uncharacterized protein LOC107811198 [Nicotiana tabacum]XP_016491569.1 PREDICTED: uncharacterized protein LOC107811198 [Nicotiana tabacum]XP_033513916.1 uncharacterized protein LOC104103442 [Nicotiana tomentosiformis]